MIESAYRAEDAKGVIDLIVRTLTIQPDLIKTMRMGRACTFRGLELEHGNIDRSELLPFIPDHSAEVRLLKLERVPRLDPVVNIADLL